MPGKLKALLVAVLLAAAGWWFVGNGTAAVTNAPPPAGPIVALGDSLTAGVGAPPGQGYIDVLTTLIGKPIVNRGIGGNTVADGLGRLERDVLAEKPGIVIVLLGGNDLLRRNDPDKWFADLESIVTQVQAAGAMVVLVGLDGLLLGDVADRYEDLAQARGCVFVPDILDDIYGNPKMMADQIHPNAAGQKMMAERVAAKLKPYIQ